MNFRAMCLALLVPALATVFAAPVAAVDYYVDFDGGSNSADGRSPQTAFKHCPGDASATGIAATTVLAAGDRVVFKGGVNYRSTVTCKWSGSDAQPIVYDGNTSGDFGNGRAIIDGSERLTGWQPCASADEAGGNSNWQHIYRTRIPAGVSILAANLYDGEQMLWAAQDPNPGDPFHYDSLSSFRPVSHTAVTRTTLTDATYFTQSDPADWNGSVLLLWGLPNVVRALPVTQYDPAAHTVTFADTGQNSLYDDRTVYYAMINHLRLLDTPGEFVIGSQVDQDGMRQIWLWPLAGETAVAERPITYSVRRKGIELNGKSHLIIQGFQIEKHTSGKGEYGAGIAVRTTTGGSGIVIRDNLLTRNRSLEKQGVIRMYGGCSNITIEDNIIENNPVNAGSIVTFDDSIYRNNRLARNGGTAIDFYGCRRSQMVGNVVTNHKGVHANGLTLYLGCEDVLVAYNSVYDGYCALTIQDSRNLTIAYNILHTSLDTYTIGDWGRCDGLFYYNNVMVNSYRKAVFQASSTVNTILRNNIVDGSLMGSGPHISHNIYTSLGWNQNATYGWTPGEGDQIISDKSLIFVDHQQRDFRLIATSPAIDAGIAIAGLNRDHAATSVPQGNAVDVGAFEFVAGVSIASWKSAVTHGESELQNVMGDGYVESRLGGIGTIRVAFSTDLDAATVDTGLVTITGQRSGDLAGNLGSVSLADPRTILITFAAALPDADRITITIGDSLRSTDGQSPIGALSLTLALLAGDVDSSGEVTAADVAAVRARAASDLSGEADYRYDIDTSGTVSGADMQHVRRRIGNSLP